jgi:hypothetical protein
MNSARVEGHKTTHRLDEPLEVIQQCRRILGRPDSPCEQRRPIVTEDLPRKVHLGPEGVEVSVERLEERQRGLVLVREGHADGADVLDLGPLKLRRSEERGQSSDLTGDLAKEKQ